MKKSLVFNQKELSLIEKLNTPRKVQQFIDLLGYNWEKNGETLRSFRRVLNEEQGAHCLEATFVAATILHEHGYPSFVLDMESKDQLDHCVFVYLDANSGKYGSIGISREAELGGRVPRFRTVRDLVMSYYDSYVDETACLKAYTVVDLEKIPRANWRFSANNIWKVQNYLCELPHRKLIVSSKRFELAKKAWLEKMHENKDSPADCQASS